MKAFFTNMKKEHRILLIVGVFYLFYVMLFISHFDFNPSATMELSERFIHLYNAELPPGLVVQIDSDGYDGQFFYMIATDLFLDRISVEPFRYQRIMYPFLAVTFSLGVIDWLPLTLLVINIVSIILGTYVLLLILKKHNVNLNLALLWAFNLGFFITVIRDLCTPLLFFFILLAFYFFEKDRFKVSSIFLTLAILTKETALVIIIPLLLFLLIKKDIKKFTIYTLPLVVFSLWQVALFFKFGYFVFSSQSAQLSLPFVKLTGYIFATGTILTFRDFLIYITIFPILIFVAIQAYIMIRAKKKTVTPYTLILLFEIIFLVSLETTSYVGDALGRCAMGFFLFSILYSAERKERYNRLLIVLMILMSVAYFIDKIIFFQVGYYIT